VHVGNYLTLSQMMYVSGETAEASAETTGMIEEIVRQQVIEMVCCV
jgi:transcription initiation protein SPT3